MKKHILVAGYYGFNNSGDEAILRVLLKDIQHAGGDPSICVLSGDPDATRRIYGVEAIAHGDVAGIIEQVRRSDALVVGGGGIFQDYWGAQTNTLLTNQQAGLPFYSSLPMLGCLMEKPVLIYSVGVGPLFSAEARELTRLSFKVAALATVRDAASKKLLQSIGIPTSKIQVTADLAFALQADPVRAREILDDLSVDSNRPVVGVCLRNWDIGVDPSAWQAATASALDQFTEKTGCSYLFLPFQDLPVSLLNQDSLAAAAVISRMTHQHECMLLPAQEDPAVTAGILSTCRLVIGMRFHAIVFAAGNGVVPLALAYDPKVTQLMQSLGLQEASLQLSEVSGSELFSSMINVWDDLPRYGRRMAARVAALRKSAAGNAQAVQSLLAGKLAPPRPDVEVDRFVKEFALRQTWSMAEKDADNASLQGQLLQKEKDARESIEMIKEKDQAIQELTANVIQKDQVIKNLAANIQVKEGAIQELSAQFMEQEQALNVSTRRLAAQKSETESYIDLLNQVYHSRAWKLMLLLWGLRKGIAPPGSLRERGLRSIWRLLRGRTVFPRGITFKPPFPFNERYIVEDNSRVTLYTDDPLLFPAYPLRNPLSNTLPDRLKVSLIASVKNEVRNTARWMECIQKQSRLPDEIVILDGGSTDGTDRLLQEWSGKSRVPVRLIRAPGANIARGRNIAIREARYPIIAVTDFGCEPKTDWLELLLQPFKLEPGTRVSAGFYESIGRTGKILSGNGLWPGLGQVDPQGFLPSTRSVAFRKDALDEVGGHPEWLTRTGEDTYLDLELKRLGGKWAFVPSAQVKWVAPESLGAYLDKMYQWAAGDGESGVHARYYWQYVKQIIAWLVLFVFLLAVLIGMLVWLPSLVIPWAVLCLLVGLGALAGMSLKEKLGPQILVQKALARGAQVLGFLKGARNWKEVDRRRRSDLVGLFFILSGVPLDDTGGGARGTQIAQELLHLGWGVVFLNKFERDETVDLQLKNHHPHLFLSPSDHFNLQDFAAHHPGLLENKPVRVLIEFPLPEFLPQVKRLRESYSAEVVYDLLDDWNTSLGGKWYSPAGEDGVIEASTHLVATLPALVKHLETKSGREVLALPNAVNTRLFDPAVVHPRPADLPEARRTLVYIGALWGDWFDWDLVGALADSLPGEQVVMVGDYRGQAPFHKSNVLFLGLKAQKELPAYLAHADIALLPWKVNAITQSTSPLKIYEYLAMRLPVVAPALEPLRDMPGVFTSKSREEFLHLAASVTRGQLDEAALGEFIRQNSWTARLEELLAFLDRKVLPS
jgi:polysaccharide pyruvyl transferase CsaB